MRAPRRVVKLGLGLGLLALGPPSFAVGLTGIFQVTGTVPGLPTQCGIPSENVAACLDLRVGVTSGTASWRAVELELTR
jgi:hypothetical protein